MTTNSPSFAKLGEGIASLFGFGGETPVARAGEGIGLSNIFTRSLLLSLIFFVFVGSRAPVQLDCLLDEHLLICWPGLLPRILSLIIFPPSLVNFWEDNFAWGTGKFSPKVTQFCENQFHEFNMWGRWSFTSLLHMFFFTRHTAYLFYMWCPGDDWETVAAPRGSRRRAGLTRGRLWTFGLNFFHFVVIVDGDGDGDYERASWSY